MIDLSHINTLIEQSKCFAKVAGITSAKNIVNEGIDVAHAACVMPLRTQSQQISAIPLQFAAAESFAVLIAMRTQGNVDDAKLFALYKAVICAVLGQLVPGHENQIKLGNGGLLPVKADDCVVWQQEFYIETYIGEQ